MNIQESIAEKRKIQSWLDEIYKDDEIIGHSDEEFIKALELVDKVQIKKELEDYKKLHEDFKINISNEEQICKTFVYFYDALIMCGECARPLLKTLAHLKDVYVDVNLGFSEYTFQTVLENKQLMLTVIKRVNSLMKFDESNFDSIYTMENVSEKTHSDKTA